MAAFDVRVSWDGTEVGGLRTVGPLQATVGVIRLYEGGLGRVHKVPGRPDTGAVTLQREVSDDLTLDLWARGPHLHKEVDLSLVDAGGGPTVVYRMHQCWVSEYAVTPDLETGVVVESITLSMDAWERVTPPAPKLAEQIAAQLGRQVVRLDARRLVGATVEESERRVDEIIREAEASGALLLLDEAEAIFARRTEIADAHDRYAATPLDAVVDRLSAYSGPILVVPPDAGGDVSPPSP